MRRSIRHLSLAAVTSVGLILTMAPAQAADWKKISGTDRVRTNATPAALAVDGERHIAWTRMLGSQPAPQSHFAVVGADGGLESAETGNNWETGAVSLALAPHNNSVQAAFMGAGTSAGDLANGWPHRNLKDPATGWQRSSAAGDYRNLTSWEPRAKTPGSLYAGDVAVVTQADGTTPVTAVADSPIYARNQIVWRTGADDCTTSSCGPNKQIRVPGSTRATGVSLVRKGPGQVWAAWHSVGTTAASTGTFVRRLLPTEGKITKIPGSSQGRATRALNGPVPLTVDGEGDITVAFCQGGAACSSVALWQFGKGSKAVAGTRGATTAAATTDKTGRVWLTWAGADNRNATVRTSPDANRIAKRFPMTKPGGRTITRLAVVAADRNWAVVAANNGRGIHTQQLQGTPRAN